MVCQHADRCCRGGARAAASAELLTALSLKRYEDAFAAILLGADPNVRNARDKTPLDRLMNTWPITVEVMKRSEAKCGIKWDCLPPPMIFFRASIALSLQLMTTPLLTSKALLSSSSSSQTTRKAVLACFSESRMWYISPARARSMETVSDGTAGGLGGLGGQGRRRACRCGLAHDVRRARAHSTLGRRVARRVGATGARLRLFCVFLAGAFCILSSTSASEQQQQHAARKNTKSTTAVVVAAESLSSLPALIRAVPGTL